MKISVEYDIFSEKRKGKTKKIRRGTMRYTLTDFNKIRPKQVVLSVIF